MSDLLFEPLMLLRFLNIDDLRRHAGELVNLEAARVIEAAELATEADASNADSEAFLTTLRVNSVFLCRPYSFLAGKAFALAKDYSHHLEKACLYFYPWAFKNNVDWICARCAH